MKSNQACRHDVSSILHQLKLYNFALCSVQYFENKSNIIKYSGVALDYSMLVEHISNFVRQTLVGVVSTKNSTFFNLNSDVLDNNQANA